MPIIIEESPSMEQSDNKQEYHSEYDTFKQYEYVPTVDEYY